MASRLSYAPSAARAHIRRNLIEQQLPALPQLVHQGAIPIGRQHPLLLEGNISQHDPLLRQQAPATAKQGAAVVPPLETLDRDAQHRPLAGPVLTHHPARQAAGEAIEGQLVQLGIEGTCPAMVLGKVQLLALQLIDQAHPVKLTGQGDGAQHQLVLRLRRGDTRRRRVSIQRIVMQRRRRTATSRQQAQQGQRYHPFFHHFPRLGSGSRGRARSKISELGCSFSEWTRGCNSLISWLSDCTD